MGWDPVHFVRRPLVGLYSCPIWWVWVWRVRHKTGPRNATFNYLLFSAQYDRCIWNIQWNEDCQGKPKFLRKKKATPVPLFPTQTHMTWPGMDLGCHGGKLATGRLVHHSINVNFITQLYDKGWLFRRSPGPVKSITLMGLSTRTYRCTYGLLCCATLPSISQSLSYLDALKLEHQCVHHL